MMQGFADFSGAYVSLRIGVRRKGEFFQQSLRQDFLHPTDFQPSICSAHLGQRLIMR
jgi:hypothetical protein